MWSNSAVCTLIELMKSHEELWKICCKNFSNRALKAVSMSRCVELLKEEVPGVSPSDITSRIKTIKNRYNKEKKKLTASAKSGAGVADLEISTWWCNDKLSFLAAGEINEPSVTNMADNTTPETVSISVCNNRDRLHLIKCHINFKGRPLFHDYIVVCNFVSV